MYIFIFYQHRSEIFFSRHSGLADGTYSLTPSSLRHESEQQIQSGFASYEQHITHKHSLTQISSLLQNSGLHHCLRKEGGTEGEKRESEEAEKGRQEAAEWDKERERERQKDRVKRAVYHSLMALVKRSRDQALSPASVTAETAAHISSSPGESEAPPGGKNEEE